MMTQINGIEVYIGTANEPDRVKLQKIAEQNGVWAGYTSSCVAVLKFVSVGNLKRTLPKIMSLARRV